MTVESTTPSITDWRIHKCKGTVYLITCEPEEKSYVGITRRPPEHRFQGHRKGAEKGIGDHLSLQEALRTYGDDSFTYEILDKAATLGELSDKEIFYIDKLKTLAPGGYNKNRGGSVSVGVYPFYFEKELFQSVADLADHYEIFEETLRLRLKAKWSMREAVGLEDRPKVKVEGKKFDIKGQKFSSQAELCEFFEITLNNFRSRQRMGWSLEESLGLQTRERKKRWVVSGIEYNSLSDVCIHYKVNKEKIRSRLNNGMDLEAAIFVDYLSGNRIAVSCEGMDFDSLADAANYYKVSPSLVRNRLRRGHGLAIALGLEDIPKTKWKKRDREEFIIDGALYSSFAELERSFSVKADLIRSRVNAGKSLIDAILEPVKEAARYKLDEIDYTIDELCEKFNIKRQTLSYRIKQDWSIKQAVGISPKPAARGKKIVLQGKEFPSITAAARHYGFKLPMINSRLNNGYSLEQAFDLKPREVERINPVYVLAKDGVEFTVNNLSKFARENSLSSGFAGNILFTIKSNINHSSYGYTIREATLIEQQQFYDLPKNKYKRKGLKVNRGEVTYQGKSYKSKKALCERFDLNCNHFYRVFGELKDVDLTMKKLMSPSKIGKPKKNES